MLTPLLHKLTAQQALSSEDMQAAITTLLNDANFVQVGAFLSLLTAKGITAEELSGAVQMFQKLMLKISVDKPVFDIAGTGGDGCNTVNISTPTAIALSSFGIDVVKHGNRAASSQTGSADLMEGLGIRIQLLPGAVLKLLAKTHFTYCFTPNFHPAAMALRNIRQQLKLPTIFNLVGPLLNPAQAKRLMIGVYKPALIPLFAETLLKLDIDHALVFHGQGTDEITTLGPTEGLEIQGKSITPFHLDPKAFGLSRCQLADLQGGNAQQNAALIEQVFAGKPSALADTIALNIATALYLNEFCSDIASGLEYATEALQSNQVMDQLNHIRQVSHE